MAEYEDESDMDRWSYTIGIGRSPSHASHKEEQRQKVGECGICSVIGVFGFWGCLLTLDEVSRQGRFSRTFLLEC